MREDRIDWLAGKPAVVPGAGQGVSRAPAITFARAGAEVVAISCSGTKMADQLDAALDCAGDVDILLNCAKVVFTSTAAPCSDAKWEAAFGLNVTAPFPAIRQLLPRMRARGRGSIVNIASVTFSITGVDERVRYGVSKASLIGLTKAVARKAVMTGMRCNGLCLGTTHSPALEDRIATEDPDETWRRFVSRQPMGRLGKVEEIAAAALYLASDAAAFMTRQLVVEGGQAL